MRALKLANLGLRFLLELCALAALAYWGLDTGRSLFADVVLGLGAPVMAAALWNVWVAPRSERRLSVPGRLVAEALVFGAAAAGLVAAGQPALGLALAAAAILSGVVNYAGGEVEPGEPSA